MTDHASIVERALRVHGHLEPHEHQGILKHWSNLDHKLRAFGTEAIDIQLFVTERDTPNQRVTLEVRLPGHRTLVATATRRDLGGALRDVRDSMARQLGDLHARDLRAVGRRH